jgi:signal transduction histidine kinase
MLERAVERVGPKLSGALVSILGAVMFAPPLFDIYDDLTRLGGAWTPTQTLIENSVLIALATLLVGGGVWLARRDWRPTDRATVVRWTYTGAVGVAAVLGWVLYLQLWAMGEPKPYILVLDSVLLGTVAAFGLGVARARQNISHRGSERQRERMTALFEDADDPIVAVHAAGAAPGHGVIPDGGIETAETNGSFERTFSRSPREVFDALEAASEDTSYAVAELVEHVRSGEQYAARVRLPGDTDRYFRLRTVPAGGPEAFVVLTDTTEANRRREELARRSEELEAEKTERERELERRTEQLEFLHSLLRHDVQNGMMVVEARAEVLEEELGEDLADYAETIRVRSEEISDQIDRMRTTLDTLTGEGRATEAIDAGEVVDEQAEAVGASYPDAEISTDVGDGDLRVQADEIFPDVVGNLLENAVVHNDKPTPEVDVRVHRRDERVRLEVADNGPGIDPERREEVFRRGVTSAGPNHGSGSGFGLFFVDTMVEGYGGHVEVTDSEPGGSEFVVDLIPAEGRDE